MGCHCGSRRGRLCWYRPEAGRHSLLDQEPTLSGTRSRPRPRPAPSPPRAHPRPEQETVASSSKPVPPPPNRRRRQAAAMTARRDGRRGMHCAALGVVHEVMRPAVGSYATRRQTQVRLGGTCPRSSDAPTGKRVRDDERRARCTRHAARETNVVGERGPVRSRLVRLAPEAGATALAADAGLTAPAVERDAAARADASGGPAADGGAVGLAPDRGRPRPGRSSSSTPHARHRRGGVTSARSCAVPIRATASRSSITTIIPSGDRVSASIRPKIGETRPRVQRAAGSPGRRRQRHVGTPGQRRGSPPPLTGPLAQPVTPWAVRPLTR